MNLILFFGVFYFTIDRIITNAIAEAHSKIEVENEAIDSNQVNISIEHIQVIQLNH